MTKEVVSMDAVRNCIEERIKHLKVQTDDWSNNTESVIDSYCKADKIRSDTALINVCNIVNHAGEIKARKFAIDELELVLSMLDSLVKRGE